MKNNEFIWLFGENEGRTANNNSYYMWEQVVENKDEILKYYIVKKNKNNIKIVKNLPKAKRKFVVWQNSIKHWKLFMKASMGFVSLSYKDVFPNKLFFKNVKINPNLPIVYLQHGTLAIKKLGYTGHSYKNNIFKFLIYNKEILNQFSEENKFEPYQLYYLGIHPRYKKLVEMNRTVKREDKKQILFFPTWREYFGENEQTTEYINKLKKLFSDKRLNKFLQDNDYKIKLCLHQFFTEEAKKEIVKNVKNIEVVCPKDVDVMCEIAKSELLITDYSSLGFDFTFLDKPVILYQPDLDTYLKYRDTYCSVSELKKYSVQNEKKLIDIIVNKKFKVNEFFKKGIPDNINYADVEKGTHIDKLYEDMKTAQLNSVAFIGYNFYGKGGTVSATKALAEAFLEKGYLVRMFSLKKTKNPNLNMPAGLNTRSGFVTYGKSKKERLKRLFKLKLHYSDLKYDCNKKLLIPYTGIALKKYLKNTTCKTVISTRESLHLFLNKTKNNSIKNKIYFFHTDANVVDKMYPNLMDKLKEVKLDNCAFVTTKNYEEYIKKFNMNNISNYTVVGNALQSTNMVDVKDIKAPNFNKRLKGITLIRMSNDRKNDIDKIIEFGRYLKTNDIKKITIDVFGMGPLVDWFENRLKEEKLDRYIKYKGATDMPHEEIRKHDYLIDFALNQSFGMTYIEGILNGKKVYATKNSGSLEVLSDIPNSYYSDFNELTNMILNIDSLTEEELKENYNKILKRYSRQSVLNKLESIICK